MANDQTRYALASQTYLTHLSLRPKQDQARRANIKSDLQALATNKKTAAEEIFQKCQTEKQELAEEREVKVKELKAKHEQQLVDLKRAQEVEKEAAERAWVFKMEMEEEKIEGRQGALDKDFENKKGKLEEEWAEKRKQLESKWAKEDELFNDVKREIQSKKTLVSRLPGFQQEELRLENAAYQDGSANNHFNRVVNSDRLPYDNGPRRTGERERERERDGEYHGVGNTNRPPSRASFGRRDEPPRAGASYRPHYEDSRGPSPARYDTWRPPPRTWEINRPVSDYEAKKAKWKAAQARSEEARLYAEMIEAAKASDNGPSRPGPVRYDRQDQYDDLSYTHYNHQGQYGDYGRDIGYRGPTEHRNASPPRAKPSHRLSPSREEGPARKRAKRAPRETPSRSRCQAFPVSMRPNPMVTGNESNSSGNGLQNRPPTAPKPISASFKDGGSLPKKPKVSGK